VFKQFVNINWFQGVIAIAFFITFCIYFIPSQNHPIRVHDTFDGNFTSRHVLIQSGHFFSTNPNTIVPGIMNGLPRGVFFRFTELTGLLMFFFGSLTGFSMTFILVRLIAFFGIFFFGKDHLNIPKSQIGVLLLVSVMFACLPVFVVHGTTVAGIPFLLWASYNLLKNQKEMISFLVILFFALWSNFVLVGFHITLVLGILFFIDSIKKKKVNRNTFLGITILVITYIFSDYMLFYLHGMDENYISSRSSFERELGLNFNGVIGGAFTSFFTGDYSTANYFGYLFAPLFLWFAYKLCTERTDDKYSLDLIFFSITVLSAFFINLLDWKGMSLFYEKFSFANTFNFKRFTSILPGFFFLTVLIATVKWNTVYSKWGTYFTSSLIVLLYVFIWRGNISYNNSGFNNTGIKIEGEEVTTFNQFFDPSLYNSIKREMGKDSTSNIIHFGLSPSPSKYAGIHVLDDYQGDYPKSYKIQFRKVIKKELEKSTDLKYYFDNWGARCYLYSSNSFKNTLAKKYGHPYEPKLEINTQQLKEMNCHYILSTILIGNAEELGIILKKVLVGTFAHKVHFVYQII
jgi:hypothetical protein